MKDTPYQVVILAAGHGTRLGSLTKNINKALLPVNFKPVLSHLLEKISPKIPLVVAVGHESKKLKEYFRIAHANRTVTFVTIDKTEGLGSGPGYSLLKCRSHIRGAFILATVDTIILENVPSPTKNWLGIAPIADTSEYNSVAIRDGLIQSMSDKKATRHRHAFIGICGIKDYQTFWKALEKNSSLIKGEIQLSNGLHALITCGLHARPYTWFDTGTLAGLQAAEKFFRGADDEFDFSKQNEYIYFINKSVIKYFADPDIVQKRVSRAQQLAPHVPQIRQSTEHFYSYQKREGTTLYKALTIPRVQKFFAWLQTNFWEEHTLTVKETKNFNAACHAFYYDKTISRLQQYFKSTHSTDEQSRVNGVLTPRVEQMIKKINWSELCRGIPSTFHGDLQFDNVLVTSQKKRPFVLLDWRQDFAGLQVYGDRYYDLAKIYGGIIVPYHLIKKNMFSLDQRGKNISFDITSTYVLQEARHIFQEFALRHGYDLQRIKILTSLIFLNMAPLHNRPFSVVLHYLGKLELARSLGQIR